MCLTGCRIALPSEIPAPVIQTPVGADPQLENAMRACANHLNGLRGDAKSVGTYADAMTLIGGGIAAASGVTAAALPSEDKAAKITAASLAAGGGLLAVLSKLVDSPTYALTKYSKAARHWDLGLKVVRENAAEALTPGHVAHQFAMARFADCLSDNPQDPPVPPEDILPQTFSPQ